MIKVIVADDQRLLRDGLSTLLRIEPEIEVAGTAANGKEAYDLAMEVKPDVVLMDIRMPGVDGIAGTRMIRESLPGTKVLILTTFEDGELIVRALNEGAAGYLLKDMPSETIVSAIHTVHAGGTVLQPNVASSLLNELRKAQQESPAAGIGGQSARPAVLDELTEREHDVLRLLGSGMNNREIADKLFVTEGTVKNYVSSIIAKTELRDRTQVAVFAVRNGIADSGAAK